ncbi:MAG: DNA-directed RNA polymerase subunit alpha [bacterium]|nr:DNA-directed RNA polymerase subunit alpha [bacterium]
MINLPNAPKIIKKENNKAVFEIEALYPGYGTTIGNSLRRVLLSSLPGAAVTQVKIKGVSHEFSTIPGVLEDVVLILLNLKQLRFKLFTKESQKATLKIKGEKEAKGVDFNLSSQAELINKNCHIATLTSKSAELEIEILIEKGIGFSSRDARKKSDTSLQPASSSREKLEIGAIALDAFFTPVRKVSYKVENMRVGERTDYDRLFLEIETDGSISPETALAKSSEILLQHFTLLFDALEPKIVLAEISKEEKAKKTLKKKKPVIVKKKSAKSKRTKSSS